MFLCAASFLPHNGERCATCATIGVDALTSLGTVAA
jgi:hypothetical protein